MMFKKFFSLAKAYLNMRTANPYDRSRKSFSSGIKQLKTMTLVKIPFKLFKRIKSEPQLHLLC